VSERSSARRRVRSGQSRAAFGGRDCRARLPGLVRWSRRATHPARPRPRAAAQESPGGSRARRAAGGGKLAGASVELQDLSFDRCRDQTAGDFSFTRVDGCLGLGDARTESPDGKLRRSHSSRLMTLWRASLSARPSWFSRSASSAVATASAARWSFELSAQVAVVDLEQRIPALDALANADENPLDDAGDVRPNGDERTANAMSYRTFLCELQKKPARALK
jgi:hypothetical protein